MTTTQKALLSVIDNQAVQVNAKRIWRHSPLLESMTIKLANFVGIHAQTHGGETLLAAAICAAAAAYANAEIDDGNDDAAVNAYADQIIQHAVLVFSQTIYVATPSGEVKWMPFECSLLDFVRRHDGTNVSVLFREPLFPKALAVAFVMAKLVPYPLLEASTSSTIFTDIVN
ncbi:hypothetical protein [Noviherbaspirillum malthae]|uniref:hypothetical protein n=1 Tax=Noviherbaspirillum malthae TaxID=1260987 RepID=UPI00188FBE66|nr:hypothetical protein [Noviherbaspirillum malthae]